MKLKGELDQDTCLLQQEADNINLPTELHEGYIK